MGYPELSWLPPPENMGSALSAIGTAADAAAWASLSALSQTALNSLDTMRLDRVLARLFQDKPPPALETRPVRLAVLASSTVAHLVPGLRVGALRRGLWMEIYTCAYGQYERELLDRSSPLHAFEPTAVLFCHDAAHVTAGFSAADCAEAARQKMDALLRRIAGQWTQARTAFGCAVLQQTVLPVFPALMGSNEGRLPGSPARLAGALNERLAQEADASGVDLMSLDAAIARDGLRAWHEPALWHRAKQEIHPAATHVYGDLVGRLLAAQQGRSRKCLVLDLDNTLWGGVVGDDGVEGIVLGQGHALGEAFLSFQRYAKALAARGVILAVCSKNDEANAWAPFDHHPEMALTRQEIACFVANWSDKAANLREIAQRLNIGLDSLVFVDDNPFERNIVRRELPMVAVPELPADPADYTACLSAAGYFEATRLTEEDWARGASYQANLARQTIAASATDLDGYLSSLEMEARWGRFDRVSLPRVVQLINKTNQFNLTTIRTTDEAAARVMQDPRALSLRIRLLDRFGDNGIIAVVTGRFETASTDMLLDTWLMSCRVLGRGVEDVTLALAIEQARRLGAQRLIGEYRPSAKNGMVRDHYARLGFAPVAELAGGVTRWALDLAGFAPRPSNIRLVEDA